MIFKVYKIEMYGNNLVGEYADFGSAEAKKAELKAGPEYGEYFVEIVPANDNNQITGLGA